MLILYFMDIAVASYGRANKEMCSGLCQPCRRSRLGRAADHCGHEHGGLGFACVNDTTPVSLQFGKSYNDGASSLLDGVFDMILAFVASCLPLFRFMFPRQTQELELDE